MSSLAMPSKFWIGVGIGPAPIGTAGGNCVALLAGPIGRAGNISFSSQSLSSSFWGTGRNVRTSPSNRFATTGVTAWTTATASALAWSTFRGCALADEKKPTLSSARNRPARKTNKPIKTRRLKKADFELDFFFMDEVELFPSAGKPEMAVEMLCEMQEECQ